MRRLVLLFAFALTALPFVAQAQRATLEISGATFRPYPIAVANPLATGDEVAPAEEIHEALSFDLMASGLFDVVPRKAFLADPREPATAEGIVWTRWSDVSAEGLVKVQVTPSAGGVQATFRLYDVATHRQDLVATYEGRRADARRLAHRFADDLVKHFTGEPGAFSTRIAFVKRGPSAREVWVADWDGKNAAPVSERGGGMALLPAWSPAGDKVVYTLYKRSRNYPNGKPELWRSELPGGRSKALVSRGDIATGGAFSPDGKKIAFTLADEGNSEIYVINADGSGLKRITNSPGIDTSPSWSPDGQKLAFVSDRHGNPQIFVANADGTGVERLTFAGNYNQTPVWSPRGDEIAFTARDERLAFDVFVIKVGSKEIRRITQGQGNNEGPTWAPNGRMMMFTSDRDGTKSLWVSSADGNVQHKIGIKGKAAFVQASWGPLPAAK
ncbi:Tol-Pal system beta propeller repeat protein TolB [Vulgatibacter sp.]|uniref:Tol-Pal system beta propeller repeat protein TolB n=1 Tax=Vulgatibacter sp. TaxID=1971226 RepID=UPI00356A1BE6